MVLVTASPLLGQTPQPFPGVRPSQPAPQNKPAAPPTQGTTQTPPAAPAQPAAVPLDPNAPSSAVVGFPIYAGAQFLADYDAGKKQRYYLFGTVATYAEVVKYYQGALKDRGTQVFTEPPTHAFTPVRFREETMAFPPGVTVKDYTFGGFLGYLNPKPGAQPARFPTVIQIVPPPEPPPAK